MATVTQSFPKILKMLRETSSNKEKREALTYIRSNFKKLESSNNIKEEQYKDLCKLVIDASMSKDQNIQHEAYDTLTCIVQNFRSHKLNLFESMLHINRKDRLKILKLLDVVDDIAILIAANDKSIFHLLNDCMHTVQPVTMNWLLPTACTDNLQKLTEIENRVLSNNQKIEEEMINYSLNLLRRLYKVAAEMADNKIQRFDELLMEKVVLLAYMGHKRQRSPALKVLQQAITTNLATHVRNELPDVWTQYKTDLQSTYCKRMQLLVTVCELDWAVQWNISVQLLGTDLHRGASLINNLLSVEERAFKSSDAVIRRQAFLSWKLLIDNFALDSQELGTTRRIKLLCIPLNAKNSKTELIALTKLEVWWHLIIKLYKDIGKFVDPVITQFLNFCFGPLGDTPLLSSKCDVASPGKRFFKTKLVAVDALSQLLVAKQEKHMLYTPILEEMLPHCICGTVFQQCYKSIIHSVGEALLILSQINDKEMKNRCQAGKLLWSSLVNYAQESQTEIKDLVYKDILLVINELVNHIADKPMIQDLILDVIIIDLPNFNKDIQIHSGMLSDLLFKLFSTSILQKIKKNHCKGLNCLLWECVKPKIGNEYCLNTLEFLKTVLDKITQVNVEDKSTTVIPEIWCIVAEILTKYMEDSCNINEGNAAQHNFKTTEYILKFPFTHIFLKDLKQVQEISGTWKKLYKQFDLQGDLVVTVKSNETLLSTIKMMQCCLNKNKDCNNLITSCLDTLLNTINFNSLLACNEVPSVVEFLIDLIRTTFNNSQFTDCDITLKALSAVLITVYGHDPKKAILCLQYVKPVIELVLVSSTGTSLKEITNMWEIVISIFKGLEKSYSSEFLSLYKEIIIQSINHSNIEIATQTLSFLDEENNFDEKGQRMVQEIHKRIKPDKLPFKLNNAEKKIEDNEISEKQMKMAGSFLNRKSVIPKMILIRAKKENDEKRISMPDPEAQEYVYIKTDVKYDVNRLTDHQKEILKKKRDDIPALYNDLSQSSSQSTQNLQEWFDKRGKRINETDYAHDATKNNPEKEENIDHDANKENTIESTITEYIVIDKIETISNTDLKAVQQQIDPPVQSTSLLSEDSTSNKASDNNTNDNSSKEQTNLISEIFENDKLGTSLDDDKEEIYDQDELDSVAKRLNFESRDEFSDEKESEPRLSSPSVLENGKRRNRNSTTKTGSNELDSDKTTNTQDEQSESKMLKTLKTKSSLIKHRKGTKRKYASDSDSEETMYQRRRRKYTISETPSDSDSVPSVESEHSEGTKEEQCLSQRTKNEISRLKINMVFYSALPNRRRSKQQEQLKDTNCEIKNLRTYTRKSPELKNTEETKSSVCGQSSLKKKNKKSFKSESNKNEELPMIDAMERAVEKETSNTDMGDSKSDESTNVSSEITDNTTIDIQDEITDKDNSLNVAKIRDSKKKLKELDTNTNEINTKQSIKKEELLLSAEDGTQEIIQNSQEINVISKLEGKYNDKKCFIKIDKIDKIVNVPVMKSNNSCNKDNVSTESTTVKKSTKEIPNVPKKIPDDDPKLDDPKLNDKIDEIVHIDDNTVTVVNTSDHEISCIQREDEKKTSSDVSQVISSPTHKISAMVVSSPKNNIKRLLKLKAYPTKGGRAAHMLGLVTKQIITETNSQNVKTDEDIKKIKSKEGENEMQIGKKDKIMIFKDNDKIGGPCSSRQEKIFNNMKSGEYISSSPIKSFSNLKNDGEKLSSNVEKTIPDYMLISLENTVEKGNDGSLSPSQEKTELPMLEWSSANPPSLTASPSASILKRHRMALTECDLETTASNKRKRVSFADPPVSKQMGYEITLTDSPDKANKLSSRILLFRKDTPQRIKQTKLKFIQIDTVKDKNVEVQPDYGCEVDLQCERENELLTKIAEELEYTDDNMVIDDHTTCSFSENMSEISETKLYTEVTLDNLSQQGEMIEDTTIPKEAQFPSSTKNDEIFQSQESETQQDMFGSADDKDNTDQPQNEDKDVTDENDSAISSQLNITTNAENLEDTIDVGNITSLNSTANSDEVFCGKPLRTSTQTSENIADQDTLPVTDSIFGSLPVSQASESSLKSSNPELLNDTQPICLELTSCQDPINTITEYLTYPSWIKHLNSYFSSRNIINIGDLAQLTSREVNRMPVKGNSKVQFVKKILQHYINKNLVGLKSPKSCFELHSSLSVTETKTTNCDLQKEVLDMACQTEILINTDNACTTESSNLNVSSQIPSTIKVSMVDSNCTTKSVGVCTDSMVCSQSANVATKSVEAQMALEDLLDEIDVNLVMQSAVKRSTSESILAHYKMKTRALPEAEFEKETLKLLGLDNNGSYYETKLKSACRGCGINKVLLRLPDIFSGDKQFFHKVLNAYRKKITIGDCMNIFDFKEIKDFVCQKCTSSELAAMLSVILKKEDNDGIKTPMTDLSCFSDMLKRVPMDVIISHTVANDELIPPQLVLDIALQNSSLTDITETLKLQNPTLIQDVFDKLWSTELVLSHVESKSERDELLKIYKAISSKLSPKELLDAYHDSMKAKLSSEENEK
ncbi:telomere-associated protein RIF1-like isoform X1 [Vespa mandarinia]|uniref:telomere-associated protein RIF1-like isoform X1 n=1 Tax=Vespa mandarinia TaxID=7446 RepID=UPI00160C37B3|nr:telomere-associated protein RIF1-like isoform X1 [Vespa mandarinia]XP_035740337.1 telomere-associated protein RIF1-like isoform X1 [Vespa mandarinia]XP_035740346.1 telomere-associated protein RIF1-like isoform X1 [Vespa mandarinia]XP_035740355.1 telomere-associated protein RIF1-like isoform X1 [Vespa mandarinia]